MAASGMLKPLKNSQADRTTISKSATGAAKANVGPPQRFKLGAGRRQCPTESEQENAAPGNDQREQEILEELMLANS